MCFNLIDNCHIPIILEFLEMQTDKIAKFIDSIVRFVDFFPEPGKYLFGFVAEKLYQDIILIFEIKIDRTISDIGFPGDLRNG